MVNSWVGRRRAENSEIAEGASTEPTRTTRTLDEIGHDTNDAAREIGTRRYVYYDFGRYERLATG